jgi:CRP/FNR family transcriptional regulator
VRTLETEPKLESLPSGHPCEHCEIRGQAPCSVLDCNALAEFKRLGPTLRLSAGQTLFREGDPTSRVFTLTKGSLKLYRLLADGRRQVVGFKFAGDFLGISIDEEHRFTADLIKDTEFCSFPRNRFAAFLSEHPDLEYRLYRLAAHELSAAEEQFVLLGRKSALERVATFLLNLADRRRQFAELSTASVELPMSRSDIADYLGLTKETVSRAFSVLRSRRLIRLKTMHQVEILDRPALERAAEGLD